MSEINLSILDSAVVGSLRELRSLWQAWLEAHLNKPCIVLLDGDLGLGKTESVKQVAELWSLESVSSPTFSIYNQYRSRDQRRRVYHVDLYRLQSLEDLESTGFFDLFEDPEGPWIFIEWANLLDPSLWPLNWRVFHVQINRGDRETQRLLVLRARVGDELLNIPI